METGRRASSSGWWKRLLAGALLAGLLPLSAAADPLLRQLDGAVRDVWTTSEGLPHNTVNALAQTADGYLWVATWEGLVRYNGHEFAPFDRRTVPGWPDDGIRALHVGADGALWAGTARGGLARLREGVWEFPAPARGLVTDIVEDRQGRLWIATEAHGIERIGPDGSRSRLGPENGLPSNSVFDLHVAADGKLYAGTSAGLVRLVDDRAEVLSTEVGLPAHSVFALDDDDQGGLLIGSERGAWQLPADGHARQLSIPVTSSITRVLQVAGGERYFGSIQDGLLRVWEGQSERIGSVGGLPNQRIAAMLRDREGNLWLGSNRGLVRLRDAPMVSVTRERGLRDDFVRSVLPAVGGGMWVGTSQGLDWLNGFDARTPAFAEAVAGQSILSLSHAGGGELWVGTYASGLLRIGPGGVRLRLDRDSGLPSNEVRTVLDEGRGGLWVGTTLGLVELGQGRQRTWRQDDGLPGDFVSALARSADGTLWVGTATGLGRIREGRAETVDLAGVGEAEFIFGLHYDRVADLLWLSTDRGLIRLQPSTGRKDLLSLAQGLPVEKVFQLVVDARGAFWLPSNRGVIRLSPGSAEAVIAGRAERLDAVLLDESDGMATAQCNGGSSPSATLAADGTVWVATALGATAVPPDAQIGNPAMPAKLVIEGLSADGQALDPLRPHALGAQTQSVALSFVGLSFLTPEQIRYRTRLHGWDKRWVERGTTRLVEYTNLPPGDYLFEVQAANPDSAWSVPAQVRFSIAAYLWQRPAFWWGSATALLLLAGAALRWRLGHLHRREARLRQLVDQRTRDLREQTDRLLALASEREALVAQLRDQSEAFERQAREDQLTRLLNRRGFDEALKSAMQDGVQPLSLALIDLDHFKQINDRHSHAVGDAVLRAVAGLLHRQLPDGAIVARWGGEEFAVLLPGMDVQAAAEHIDALRLALAGSAVRGMPSGLRVGFSAGVAERSDSEAGGSLLQRADAALYRAKHAGRDQVISDG